MSAAAQELDWVRDGVLVAGRQVRRRNASLRLHLRLHRMRGRDECIAVVDSDYHTNVCSELLYSLKKVKVAPELQYSRIASNWT